MTDMAGSQVTVVRIYLHEGTGQLKPLFDYLHDEARVHGVTVFRGIAGFGASGRVHASTLMDLSLDLPVVLEFFEEPGRAAEIVAHLETLVETGHIVSWNARVNAPKPGRSGP